jgi:transposase
MTAKGEKFSQTTEFCEFKTYMDDLECLFKFRKDHAAEAVIMESTDVYWKSPYRVLKAGGFEPIVVNAQIVNNLRGHKTDIADSQSVSGLPN